MEDFWMRTSVGFFAMASLLVAPLLNASAQEVSLTRSYSEAREQGQKAKKPLAVFVGAGPAGHVQTIQEGSFTNEIRKILSDAYVCVYLDAERPENRALIEQLRITRGAGVILSDRTGGLQAFHHDGVLDAAELVSQLQRFADPNVVVQTTAGGSTARVSYYPSA